MKEQKGNLHKSADQQERQLIYIYVHVIRRQPAAKSVFFPLSVKFSELYANERHKNDVHCVNNQKSIESG